VLFSFFLNFKWLKILFYQAISEKSHLAFDRGKSLARGAGGARLAAENTLSNTSPAGQPIKN
jgi:hypothetical protein